MSLGGSALLLSSLLATVAAQAAFASTSVTSVGAVARGTTSATAATFTFTENSIAALAGPGTLIVTIAPASPGTGTVTFSGTPVVTAPGSLGASATASGSVLTITLTGQDPLNVEQVDWHRPRCFASSGRREPRGTWTALAAGAVEPKRKLNR